MNEIESKVKEILCDKLNVSPDEVTNDANIKEDLGGDSLDVVEIEMELEKELNIEITDEELSQVETVGDLIKLVEESSK
jgi:acyl carrier protein